MNITDAIKFFGLADDEATRKGCIEIMGAWYKNNLAAHLEYIEKGIYDDASLGHYLDDFRAQMERVKQILNEQSKISA